MDKNTKDKIILYTSKNGDVELRADAEKDTLWATQEQIGRLFGTSKQLVSWHIANVFKEVELKSKSTVKDSLTVVSNNRHYLTKFYNLDVIIAVGYRVNSKKATKFRIWATGILREYLIRGFNLNRRKLVVSDEKLNDLNSAIKFIESKSENGPLKAKITVRLSKDLIR